MKKTRLKPLWIVLILLLVISASSEFGVMARQIGYKDTLIMMAVLIAMIIGIIVIYRRRRKVNP